MEFYHDDYHHILQQAKAGDVVYCDPPYVSLNGGVLRYYQAFDDQDQLKLSFQYE